MEIFNFNTKKFIYAFLVVCGFIVLYWFSGQFYVDVDAGEIAKNKSVDIIYVVLHGVVEEK